MIRISSDADGDGRIPVMAIAEDHRFLSNVRTQSARQDGGICGTGLGQYQQQFIAAPTPEGIGVPAGGLEAPGDLHQCFISGDMSFPVIDLLELIEIDEHHTQQTSVASGSLDLEAQRLVTRASIEQFGQGIETDLGDQPVHLRARNDSRRIKSWSTVGEIIGRCNPDSNRPLQTILQFLLVTKDSSPQTLSLLGIETAMSQQLHQITVVFGSERTEVGQNPLQLLVIENAITGEQRQDIDPLGFEFTEPLQVRHENLHDAVCVRGSSYHRVEVCAARSGRSFRIRLRIPVVDGLEQLFTVEVDMDHLESLTRAQAPAQSGVLSTDDDQGHLQSTVELEIDREGRLVLPAKLRDKLNLADGTETIFESRGDYVQVYHPDSRPKDVQALEDFASGYGPEFDPRVFLQQTDEG